MAGTYHKTGGQHDTPSSPKCCIMKFFNGIVLSINQRNAFVNDWKHLLQYVWWMIQTMKSKLTAEKNRGSRIQKGVNIFPTIWYCMTHKNRMAIFQHYPSICIRAMFSHIKCHKWDSAVTTKRFRITTILFSHKYWSSQSEQNRYMKIHNYWTQEAIIPQRLTIYSVHLCNNICISLEGFKSPYQFHGRWCMSVMVISTEWVNSENIWRYTRDNRIVSNIQLVNYCNINTS